MKLQQKFIKKISLLLVISIMSLNFTFLTIPKKAEAQWIVEDPAANIQLGILNAGFHFQLTTLNGQTLAKTFWDKLEALLIKMLATVAKIAAKKLIAMITQATVEWINNGFKGSPAYVSNIDKFLTGPGGVGDQVVGQIFANDANFAFLCSPYKLQVKVALSLGYGYGLEGIGCTLTDIVKNSTNAINTATAIVDLNGKSITIDKDGKINGRTVSNFTRGGGWYAWLKNTVQPQNTPVGGYLIAKANMDTQIAAAQNTKTLDLLNGQGALSYRTCVDSYVGPNNSSMGKSGEYVDDSKSRPAPPKGVYKTEQKCDTKTPGSAITGWVLQKSTSDVRQSEMAAAFANGLDAIFGALVGAVLNLALNQLKKGVLDGDSSGNAQYNLALDSAWNGALTDYQNNLNNLNNEQNNWNNVDWNNPSSTVPTYTVPGYTPLDFGTTTSGWFPSPISATSTTATGTQVTSGGGYNTGYSPLDQAKNNSNILLNSLINSELAYQNSYAVAQNVLTQAEGVFATSSACNMSFNRNDYVLRSLLIRANVITNIEGVSNSDRTIASVPWNLQVAKASIENSNTHLAILNKAKIDVNKAGSITAVTDAMIQVNSTDFNTDPQAKMVENIKTWLRGVGSIYNSILCPINLIKVLQITTATSTAM